MKHMGKIKRGGKVLIYIAAGVMAMGLVLASCGGDDGYGGGGGAIYLVAISVNPSTSTNPNQQFMATGTYSNFAMQNVTALVTWSSSDDNVATISDMSGSKGLAACVASGPVTITATYGGIYSSISDTALLTCP